MLDKKSGSALLVLLIIVAIVALLVFARGGYFDKLRGDKDTAPNGVKVRMDDMKEKVDVHNSEVNGVINGVDDTEVNFSDTVNSAANDLIVPVQDPGFNE